MKPRPTPTLDATALFIALGNRRGKPTTRTTQEILAHRASPARQILGAIAEMVRDLSQPPRR